MLSPVVPGYNPLSCNTTGKRWRREVRAPWRPRCSYPIREWMYRCVCWRARRSVAVSHWGRPGFIHRLSMGRCLIQDTTKVCKQCRKAAGLHRCVRDGLSIGCIAMSSGCVSIGAAVGASVICSIGAVSLTGSPGSTCGKRWRPIAPLAPTRRVLEMLGKK